MFCSHLFVFFSSLYFVYNIIINKIDEYPSLFDSDNEKHTGRSLLFVDTVNAMLESASCCFPQLKLNSFKFVELLVYSKTFVHLLFQ